MNTVNPSVRLAASMADAGAGRYIAYAGRFVPEKGVHVLLEAARRMELPVKLSRNVTHLEAIDAPPGIEVVVTRSPEELDAFYRGARMLVLPSLWYDSFPTVGEEAMGHGIPVVGSRIGGVAEMIVDGVDGLHFAPGDAAELAEKAGGLWRDTARCRAMGAAARAKAVANWSAATHARRVMQVYERALGEPRARRVRA
jgi:glycosyltransferase involved in cell wall biosynthesis